MSALLTPFAWAAFAFGAVGLGSPGAPTTLLVGAVAGAVVFPGYRDRRSRTAAIGGGLLGIGVAALLLGACFAYGRGAGNR